MAIRYAMTKAFIAEQGVKTARYRELAEEINAQLAELNDLGEELAGVIKEFAENKRSAWDDSSEEWQESERGEAVAAWLDTLDEVEFTEFDDIEIEFADTIDALPVAVGEG